MPSHVAHTTDAYAAADAHIAQRHSRPSPRIFCPSTAWIGPDLNWSGVIRSNLSNTRRPPGHILGALPTNLQQKKSLTYIIHTVLNPAHQPVKVRAQDAQATRIQHNPSALAGAHSRRRSRASGCTPLRPAPARRGAAVAIMRERSALRLAQRHAVMLAEERQLAGRKIQ